MLTSSDVHEREAYFPREPGPEVERHWAAAVRAMAIAWARDARLAAGTDMAVDDATLERVADAIMDPAHPPPWVPLTPEERDDELPGFLWEAIDRHLGDHPEVDADIDVSRRGGRLAFVVRVAGDPRPHQDALARIGGDRVVVERRPPRPAYTEDELREIAARIAADTAQLAAAGLCVEERGHRSDVVEVHVTGGRDERAVAALFAARYGEAVVVRWLGRHRFLTPLRPFGSWTADGRRLRVFYGLDPNGEEPFGAAVVEESDERVVIAVKALEPVRLYKTLIGGFNSWHADVRLREPVGRRAVIDASTGVARPSLADLGVPGSGPRPGEALAAPGVASTVAPAEEERPGHVWFSATDDDAVYEAMVRVASVRDEDGEAVVAPAVRRDVLDAIRRDVLAHGNAVALEPGLRMWWIGATLMVGARLDALHRFTPRADGLYEVERLARIFGPARWLKVDPPLPDGPIDADTAVDLLSRVHWTYPTLGLIVRRLDLDVLRAVLPRLTGEILRDAVDDEIAERTHGLDARLFRGHLRALERGAPDHRDFHANHLARGPDPGARAAIRALVPDAGERILALVRAERDPDIRESLLAALRAVSPADTSG